MMTVELANAFGKISRALASVVRVSACTRSGPVRHKLAGLSRAMLYRVAMETGLRRNELRTLTPSSFELESETPTVFVEAAESKNRKTTLLPIRPELADELREWFHATGKAADTQLWPELTNHTAKMLKADLEAAGIAYRDDSGLYADFHSLRHSFVSMLAAGNVHPKLAQRLARHSDINLTMARYTHTLIADEAQALDALPQFPSAFRDDAGRDVLRATGTDNARPQGKTSELKNESRFESARESISVISGPLQSTTTATNERETAPAAQQKTPEKPAKNADSQGNQRREGDSNPRYRFTRYADLANRCIRPLCHLSGSIVDAV